MASLSRRLLLSRSLSHSNPIRVLPTRFCTTSSDDHPITPELDSDPASSQPTNPARGGFSGRPLENGVDVGVYKAILVGQVGEAPVQKTLKNGALITMFAVGTGGIRNNRRPLQNESPSEYASRCVVQWHRVCVYPEALGKISMKNALPGSIIYVEGNLESKSFSDPKTGLVRRLREIAVRRNGRLVFLGQGSDSEPAVTALGGVGYF